MHYAGQLANDLPISRDQKFISTANLALGIALANSVPNPFAGLLPGTILNGKTTTLEQTLLPYPQYGGFSKIETNGTSNYNGLQVRFEKRVSDGFHLLASYTYSKSMVTGYLNDQDTALRHWINPYDLPQVLTIASGYNLPSFENNSNMLLRQALGGWALNVIYTYTSGQLYAAQGGVQSTGLNPRIPHPTRAQEFNICTITTTGALQNCTGNEQPAWSITKPFTLITSLHILAV